MAKKRGFFAEMQHQAALAQKRQQQAAAFGRCGAQALGDGGQAVAQLLAARLHGGQEGGGGHRLQHRQWLERFARERHRRAVGDADPQLRLRWSAQPRLRRRDADVILSFAESGAALPLALRWLHRARVAAHLLADASVASIVVDCETGLVRLGLAAELARELRGGYVRLAELSAQQVAGVVRAAA